MRNHVKPGDTIEWVYRYDKSVVIYSEVLFSSTMNLWVPIGKASLLISIANKVYTWLNDNGLFHARVDDMSTAKWQGAFPRVVTV